MTVQYNRYLLNVQNMRSGLLRVMFLWRGSLYKMIWPELLVFCSAYAIIGVTYHFILNEFQKESFEKMARYCSDFSGKLPLGFVLGFFTSTCLGRFWMQFSCLAWPTDLSFLVGAFIEGSTERARIIRRNITRFGFLSFMLGMQEVSDYTLKRYPTLDEMVKSGFLMPSERDLLNNIPNKLNLYFVPSSWAARLVQQAYNEGLIPSQYGLTKLLQTINEARGGTGFLTTIKDWSFPLSYTQVVIIAVQLFSISCLIGRHKIENVEWTDYHIPFITIFEFCFYMGWLKVSLGVLNAFGNDDDDFEFQSLIDNYLQESFMVVDKLHRKLPDLSEDAFWNEADVFLPYTFASLRTMKTIYAGSAIEDSYNHPLPTRQAKIYNTPKRRFVIK